MKKGDIAVIGWFVVCIVVGILVCSAWLGNERYAGTNIKFVASNNVEIIIDKYTSMRAAGPKYFLIKNSDGTTIYGIPVEPPLYYKDEFYYEAIGLLKPGAWNVIEGHGIIFNLQNEEEINATLSKKLPDRVGIIVASIIVGFFVFYIGVAIAHEKN